MFALSKFKNLFKSQDITRLMGNFFSLSILKIFNLILPLVTLPYLIKILGFEYYGIIFFALALISYFQTIIDYGFNLSATREVARHRHSLKQLSYIYSKTVCSKLILLSGSLIFLFFTILFFEKFRNDFVIYLLMCLILIGQTMFPEWFFRGVEQMKYITILDLSVKIIFTLGVFLFINEPEDYWLYPLIFGTGYICVTVLSYIFINKKFKINFYFVDKSIIRSSLKNGFPLFINQFMPNFYNNTTNFLVGGVLGNYSMGVFGAIRQIVAFLNVFNSVVSTVFFPYLIRFKEKFYLYSKVYICLFFIVTFFIYSLHSFIFKLIGIKYENASIIFLILIAGVMSVVVYNVYATNYLIARGYDRLVMKITFLVSLFGLVASYPLIKYFGLIGGAINIFSCQFILGITAFLMFKRIEIQKVKCIKV